MLSVKLLRQFRTLDHTVQLTSFGGSGTTMLYQFLEEHDVDIPKGHDNWKPWKHLPEPPADHEVKDGFRAVYLFANPMNAILSVFRREFQYWHVRAMNMDDDYSDWGDDWDLKDFLEQDTDHFRMARHFHNWTRADRAYPILLLKFDALWRHLPEFFAFAGLPTRYVDEFPEKRERKSDWTKGSEHIRKRLHEFYGELHSEIEDVPECWIR